MKFEIIILDNPRADGAKRRARVLIPPRLFTPGHRIDIGQKVHSRVKSVPECQPTSGVAAMLKATKPEEIL